MSTDINVTFNVLCVAYNPKRTGDISPPTDPLIPVSPPPDPPSPPQPSTTGKMDLKIFRNGVEIVPTEAMLQGNFEDPSLPCGTTYHPATN